MTKDSFNLTRNFYRKTGYVENGGDIENLMVTDSISYKYAEDKIIADFKTYIDKTYGQHYNSEGDFFQAFDAWIALGDSTPTFRNTAIKYLWRYGKKNGNNKDDLMKTLHYVLMMLYNDHYRNIK
jgi:hypothetical protein